MKAKKKPVVIDYYVVDFQEGLIPSLPHWFDSFGDDMNKFIWDDGENIKVRTLEGISYNITEEDVIIRGVNGEYYPCKKDIFEKTYDKIDE